MSGLIWGLLGSVKEVDTVVPSGGHDVLDNVSLLSSSQGEPSSPIVSQNKKVTRIAQDQPRYRKAEENDTNAKESSHGETADHKKWKKRVSGTVQDTQ